jgi:hypothetical protein
MPQHALEDILSKVRELDMEAVKAEIAAQND